jgi:choline dehydrogenase-like flavoprotein
MFADARSVPRDTRLETDVCIIGAGPAGITLAREFIGSQVRVTVLESGGMEYDQETQDLYAGAATGLPYPDLSGPRLRFFGGTSNHWGGICRPFDEDDFEAREGIPFTGWPIRKADVDPFYARAVPIVRLNSGDWALGDWSPDHTPVPLQLDPDRIETRVTQVVEDQLRSFGRNYEDELRRASNVTVYLHANAMGIQTDESAQTATTVPVLTLEGNAFQVAAKVFVLGAGAIENVRLLLVSNDRHPAGLGNQHDLVGRFFLEHPRFLAATIAPLGPAPNLAFYDSHRIGDAMIRGYLASSKSFQLARGLLDLQLRVELDYGEPPEDAGDFARHVVTLGKDLESWQRLAMPGTPIPVPYLDVIRKVLDSPDDTYIYIRGRVDSIGITARIEPAPNPDSRVLLVGERDELGMRRVALDWRLSEIDKRNVRETLELFGAEIARAGIGRLRIVYDQDEGESGWPDDMGGGEHLMGTTRMSNDPKQGVVDRDCLVHGMTNLFVAGSSLFPTAGGATPTLMLVALALRLSDHLKLKVLT